MTDSQDSGILVKPKDIDLATHPERVNAGCWVEKETVAAPQWQTKLQPAKSREECIRH